MFSTNPIAIKPKDTKGEQPQEKSPANAALQAPGSFDFDFLSAKIRNTVLLKNDMDKKDHDDKKIENDENENYKFTPEQLRQLIANKQKKRPIDAHVVVGNFTQFMRKIHEDRINRKGKFPRRIQVAYKRGGKDDNNEDYEHWTALDILVTADKTHVFYLDSAGAETNLDIIQRAVVLHPNTELTLCEDIVVAGKSISLQKDNESCSVFTIDHIFHMSRLNNLHQYLAIMRTADPDHPKIFHLDPRLLPPVLIKNAQSMAFINNYLEMHKDWKDEKINKKGETLMQYVKKHMIFFPEAEREIIGSIQYKQIQYARRIGLIKK